MFTQLQAYALGEMSKGEHLGYSQLGCLTDIAIVSIRGHNSALLTYRIFGAVGFAMLVIFLIMSHAVLLQVLLKSLSESGHL